MKKKLLLISLGVLLNFSGASVFASGTVYDPHYVVGSENVYLYEESNQYNILVKPEFITDIALREGEYVQKIASGDTYRWLIDVDRVGNQDHVYIKTMDDGIETNLIVNTNKRSYRFLLKSSQSHEYIVSFSFPHQDYKESYSLAQIAENKKQQAEKNAIERVVTVDQGYKVLKNRNVRESLVPLNIFDDGTKTYVELSESNKNHMPVFYYYDDNNKRELVNYRIKDNFVEIDRVMPKLQIVFSQKAHLIVGKKVKDPVISPSKIDLGKGSPVEMLTQIEQATADLPEEVVMIDERHQTDNEKRKESLFMKILHGSLTQDIPSETNPLERDQSEMSDLTPEEQEYFNMQLEMLDQDRSLVDIFQGGTE